MGKGSLVRGEGMGCVHEEVKALGRLRAWGS